MLSNYRSDRSQSVSAGVSGSYNHPAGVAKAIKGEVKKKHHSSGWISSCFAAHLFEQDRFGPSAPDARLLDDVVTRLGLSLPAVFIAFCDEADPFRDQQSRTAVKWRP
jgi:hypothetical protein